MTTAVTTKAAHFDLVVNARFEAPRWVEDGMDVIIPCLHDGKRTGLYCKVLVAAGNHARVANPKYGIDHWYDIEELRIDLLRQESA